MTESFLDPGDFEPLNVKELAEAETLVAIRKDGPEQNMQIGQQWRDAVPVTLLVCDGDQAGELERDKPISNTALRRLLNDPRVGIGSVFIGRLVLRDTQNGTQAVVLGRVNKDDRARASELWAAKAVDPPENDDSAVDDEPPDDDLIF